MPEVSSTKRYLFFLSQDYSFPVLRPLQEAILNRGDIVRWFMYGDEINKDKLLPSEIKIDSISDIVGYNPHAVFVPGNVVPSFIPGLKVQVFHGLPGKKMKKNGQVYHYIIRGMFDLYCTQGQNSTKKFKQLANKYQYFHVLETGWSKLDPLFSSKQNSRNRKKGIFFASTFSPRYSKAEILYPFVIDFIRKYDYEWYITLHPKMSKEIAEKYKNISLDNVHFIESTEVIEYFDKSDVMLCDISSIAYEYLTQLKPVITFQSLQESPALTDVETLPELEKTLVSMLDDPKEEYLQRISKEVGKFHAYQDGNSSDRVLNCVEDMLQGKHKPVKKKPLNIFRNFKLRSALKYWSLF